MIKKLLQQRRERREREAKATRVSIEREKAKKEFEASVKDSSQVKVRELSELMLKKIAKNIESRT